MQDNAEADQENRVIHQPGGLDPEGKQAVKDKDQDGVDREQKRRDIHHRLDKTKKNLKKLMPLAVDHRRLPDKQINCQEADNAVIKNLLQRGVDF